MSLLSSIPPAFPAGGPSCPLFPVLAMPAGGFFLRPSALTPDLICVLADPPPSLADAVLVLRLPSGLSLLSAAGRLPQQIRRCLDLLLAQTEEPPAHDLWAPVPDTVVPDFLSEQLDTSSAGSTASHLSAEDVQG